VPGACLVAAVAAAAAPGVGLATPPPARSVQGRALRVVQRGDPTSRVRILVVGCIHGNECAGIRVARRLERVRLPAHVALWIVEDLNPDGHAAGTRQNADGVDLNRNFPYRWRPGGRRGDSRYPGPRALSEPETRWARALIGRVRPSLSIWFHQALGLVDLSGGRAAVERRFARMIGLPARHLPHYHGTATSFENHRMPGTTAFVVELPDGSLTLRRAARIAAAVLALARRPR
jgi:protein MpaA